MCEIWKPSSHGSCTTSAVLFTNNRSYVTGANVPPFDTYLSSQYNGDNSQFDLWVFVPLLPVTLPPHLVYAIVPLIVETDIYTDIGSTTDYIFPCLLTDAFFQPVPLPTAVGATAKATPSTLPGAGCGGFLRGRNTNEKDGSGFGDGGWEACVSWRLWDGCINRILGMFQEASFECFYLRRRRAAPG